jgi:class 3 adenylate cyclase
MDFLDWCGLVLKKLIEAGRDPHIDELRLAQLLYGEEFRTAGGFHHSTHRRGLLDAVQELVNLGLVEERTGRFWTVMPEGREFDANPAPLLRQIRSVTLEPDEKRILRVVNALSPQAGSDPPHAWLEWVKREPMLAEYGITAGFDMQEVLWPVSEDLERRGLVYRRALPGWHLDLKPTYSGLAWERRPASVSEPEMGHVLFLDIVGYSKLPMGQQTETLEQLNEIVRGIDEYRRASSENNSLIKLPTGDGMALVFFRGLTAHVRCALELGQALKEHPDLKLRTGLHSGPVYRVSDINDSRNVAGGGINMAQRVMDCGDVGHILLSKAVADNLQQLGGWEGKLHDLGEVEVKHGVKVHVYNFVDGELGNPAIPAKVEAQRDAERGVPIPYSSQDSLLPEKDENAAFLEAVDRQLPHAVEEQLTQVGLREPGISVNATSSLSDVLKRHSQFLILTDDPAGTAVLLTALTRRSTGRAFSECEIVPVRLALGRWAAQQGLNGLLSTAINDDMGLSPALVRSLRQQVEAGHTLLILESPASGEIPSEAIRWIREELVKGAAHKSRLAVVAKFGQRLAELRSIGLPIVIRPHGQHEKRSLALTLHVSVNQTRDPIGEIPGDKSVRCQIGQSWSVVFHTNDDCYLTLFCRGTTGAIYRLLLHPDNVESFARGGRVYEIPRRGEEFLFREAGPAGKEIIRALATREPLAIHFASDAGGGYFCPFSEAELASVYEEFQGLPEEHRASAECDITVVER